jgi:[ribosomal protein S18]-alanine N-acetyltransferase
MDTNTGNPIVVRKYSDADFSAVSLLEEAGKYSPYRSAVFVRQMGVCCPDTFLVAADDALPVGYTIALITQDNCSSAWILRVGVHQSYRCRGIGTSLLGIVLDELRRKNVREIHLTVAPDNSAAIHLYSRLGFVTEQRIVSYFGPGEDRLCMRCVLER